MALYKEKKKSLPLWLISIPAIEEKEKEQWKTMILLHHENQWASG